MSDSTILLTGATGFVGRWLWPALRVDGRQVRCLTRDARAARRKRQNRDWLEGDAGDRASMARALEGCEAAFYLVRADDDPGREIATAEAFAGAAADAGVGRIVYLGAMPPLDPALASERVRTRLEIGAVLRSGSVPALELRAPLIVGNGSSSWLIVRDLAARLPFMVLPRWLESRTEPVAIRDVAAALVGALRLPLPLGASYDLPGPELLSVREILELTAEALGRRRPRAVGLPVATPRLSAHWIGLVTRARWKAARDMVLDFATDVVARDDGYWQLIGHPTRQDFAAAARAALASEQIDGA